MNDKMRDILGLARIQIVVILLFLILRLIRPPILTSDSPLFVKTILLSLPNFFEAIVGMLTLTGLGLFLNDRFLQNRVKEKWIYLMAAVVTAVYTITQELKFHNLGGENITDPNDVLYSIIGLVVGYMMVLLKKPKIHTVRSNG